MSRLYILIAAFLWGGCHSQIHHGLDERQANEIQSALEGRGLRVQKVLEPGKKPTWAIEVEEGRAAEALRVLTELGLPRPKLEGFGEVFGKGSLVPTPTEERALYLEALSGEIARTLESVEGVASARVHLVLPAQRSGAPIPQAKAAAFLRVKPGAGNRVQQSKNDLKLLIASSVEGLAQESVAIVIDEVPRSVIAPRGPSADLPLRTIALVLGVATALLASAMVFVIVRMRYPKRSFSVLKADPVTTPELAKEKRAA